MNDRTYKPATGQIGRRNLIMSGVALSAAALVTGTALGRRYINKRFGRQEGLADHWREPWSGARHREGCA